MDLENLFSVKGDPDRTDKLERALDNELNGWTATVLDKKQKQLASIIVQMNSRTGPDLLGGCEVESDKVLNQLVSELGGLGRTYKTVHADTQDKRGIDVAFIYDSKKFKVKNDEVFSHFVMKRFAPRDLLHVNFYSKPSGKRLVLIGNHWPSRSGGHLESEPYRIMAGETMAYFHRRILDVNGIDRSVIALGDFINRGPNSRAVLEQLIELRKTCNVVCILGNHEETMLEARRNRHARARWEEMSGFATLISFGTEGIIQDVPDSQWHFLESFVPYLETEQCIFVHANYSWHALMNEHHTSLLRRTGY